MSLPQEPRVKLPEKTPPRVFQPNPNSWAVKQDQPLNKTPTATNRDKYENKPMPPTPKASPSPGEKPLTARKNRAYIQPAIPLKSPGPVGSSMKNRSATDPVMPKPLFASTTTTVNQLRKKYSQSKQRQKPPEDEENLTHQPLSPPLAITKKASQILGVYPVKDISRGTPPVSAPASTNTPDPFRASTESAQDNSNRQVQSTPVPTRRYLQENKLQAMIGTRTSQESKEPLYEPSSETKQTHIREGSDGSLNPTRLGIHGRKGEAELVRQSEMQRVPSFAGIIEHPDSPREGPDTLVPDSAQIDWNERTLQPQYSGEILHPMVYTPNNYAGVWENDPNVGRTLPPFSPFAPQAASEVDQRAMSQSSRDVPIVLQRFPGEPCPGSGYTHSLQSQNRWTPSSNGNSFAQADPPSSGTGTTPRFSRHVRNNSVPPPPLSYLGFQPSGSSLPGLVQMELNVHHHLDTCFSSLMRVTTDNADRTIDKLIRRFEDLQEAVEKGMKGIKGEMKDIRKEMSSIRKTFAEHPDASATLEESISSLGEKLNHLEKKIEGIGDRNQHNADTSESEHEASSAYSHENASPRRHSASARTSASSRPGQHQPYPSKPTRGSATTHTSGNSSKGRRSNTTNSSGAGIRRSEERSARRELFAEFGAANGRVPDIREHPAYRGVAEGYEQSNPIFQVPDLGQRWYQHAFGGERYDKQKE